MAKRKRPFFQIARDDARREDRALRKLLRDPAARASLAKSLGRETLRLEEITFDDLLRLAEARKCRERRLHYRLLSAVYAILRDEEWRVRFVRLYDDHALAHRLGVKPSTVGTVDIDAKVIIVDFRDEVIATVVHECLHVLLEGRFEGPKAHDREEAEVQRLEKLVMKHLSRVQARRLHRLIAARLSP